MVFDPADYRNRLVVSDGDFHAELILRSGQTSPILELANLQQPDIVRDVAEAFLDAGAKALVTNTAGANSVVLSEQIEAGHITEDQILAMNREGAAIYRAAVSEHPAAGVLVFGSMGPTEELLMLDEVAEEVLYEAYESQARALAAGGVDAIVCRGFSEIRALTVAVRAATAGTGLPVIGGMTFDSGPERNETTLGVTIPQAVAELAKVGAAMVGCDCGDHPDGAEAVVTLIRQSCDLPIWVTVNAGIPQWVNGEVVYPETPDEFAGRLGVLAAAGANLVGGGCGATAEHVAAMVAAWQKLQGPSRP
ncbi:MAG: homocysteine S-methyltransferase family protein [Phycisphaerae bacterium]|nr:homocysteine S-methyltransferase family protein [Phycisphaerae bacterium]